MGRWTKKNKKVALILGILLFSLVGVGLFLFISPDSPLNTPVDTEKTTSTFTLISSVDGEDVSNFVEINVWTPKSDATFDDEEDYYTMSKYEETKSSVNADDVSIDLSLYTAVWIEIDPDGETVFENDFHYIAGVNSDHSFFVYDLSTDVNFNILDEDTMAVITCGDLDMSGGYVAVVDVPHATETANQLHVGTNWEMEQADFDDLTANEKAFYYDEKNWACQCPTYDPAEDLEKDFDKDLEKLTEAFALMFDFNGTISTTDGDANQVNTTVSSDYPVEVIVSGDKIYFIWYETIDFEDGAYSVYFDMDTNPVTTTGTVHLDDVDSGRIVVPRDDDSLGTFTKLSDIGA